MLPNKWNYVYDKPTETIAWDNKTHTFQANSCFPAPRYNCLPYFEIFVTGIGEKGTVAIGFGEAENAKKGKGMLPGWKKGSYGYHADDGKLFVETGTGVVYGPPYATGDVVGCGITINNELYFTKNGQNLGVACALPKSKLFPSVGLDHASISTNFGQSPFMFNPFTNSRAPVSVHASNSLLAMNEPIIVHILSYLGMYALQNYANFSATCKKYVKIGKSNEVWKRLVILRWESVSLQAVVPIPSFYAFYKQRYTLQKSTSNGVLIENCMKWEFKCPAALDKLQRTGDPNVDYCKVCEKNVYLVKDMEELRSRVAKRECVAIDFLGEVGDSRSNESFMMGDMDFVPEK